MEPIKYIFEKPALTRRIAHWQKLLSKYDIEYRSQKVIKGSVLADHLAHQPIEHYQSVQYDFRDEEILYLKMKDCVEPLLGEGPEPGSRWGMVFDGAVNKYGNDIRAVIITPQGTHFHDMMHKEIEAYVDDMIAKSSNEEEHVENLLKVF